ncbi:adhesion G protein-coupled receptor A3-like [Eriocheir sinensis]|uniref:adhesion G protein-coupled receptor A3-like n=1 Tax=Eriocheir sinensis TaxID=95602 RepID=UPI0021C9A8FC|nr:adhesion G protein-coupled receptor A3-like [Eriocheir sinensis]XP_050729506.1 adhesion G protein-coupled receptor A3-like [Eriocheir sinensis]XP_050729507.1 adhesion G protein-coupled receptor A3-like [Eriocheir sinensis]XP_050729508.1 adhesion G protein-coupled receptor A3-like [Eriocheir sinensis]XP_050729509.1 adhesion G protein-coupled receptor A3-like [Eriocheir sinensis]XP_050729510.1 adhesion G protein-coupled receptor A3-like [Eriocheir sinensis]
MKICPRRPLPPPPPPLITTTTTTITSTTTTLLAVVVVVVAVTASGGSGEEIRARPTSTTTTTTHNNTTHTTTATTTTDATATRDAYPFSARNTPQPPPPPHERAPITTSTAITSGIENGAGPRYTGVRSGIREPNAPTYTPANPTSTTPSTAVPRVLSCPEVLCKITQVTGNAGEGLKVSCHDHLHITSLSDIWPHCLSPATKHLDLSESGLTRLSPHVLSHLPNLEKLDLKNNGISIVESWTFANLTNLRRLDLSNNNIKSLNASQLAGLTSLKKLKLARNPLSRLHEGIHEELPTLRVMDLAQTQLVCDCGLTWLAEAVQEKVIKVNGASKCFSPRSLNNTQIKKLKPEQLLCHGPGLSVVELEPGLDQVVFAGDSLRLRCRVTSAQEDHRVSWSRGNTHLLPRKPSPHNHTSATVTGYLDQYQQRGGAVVRNTYLPEAIESLVEIEELNGTHSGDWSCLVQGQQGNHTRTVSIYVIAHDTKYCPMNATNDNKGSYVWPRTVAGVRVELACAGLVPPHQRGSHKFTSKTATTTSTSSITVGKHQQHQRTPLNTASALRSPRRRVAEHTCSEDGRWETLNTATCPFVSETTKILEQFALTNVFASKTNLVDSARSLRNFTREGKNLQDPMDVVFLAKTVEQYTGLLTTLSGPKETADTLIDIISASMSATKALLAQAEEVDRSCARLVGCLWKVASHFPSLQHAKAPHLEMHQYSRHPSTFSGRTCTWYRRSAHSTERHFRCNTNNYSKLYSSDDEILDAQIQVPSSLFSHGQPFLLSSTSPAPPNTTEDEPTPSPPPQNPVQLQFFVYNTAKLFPRVADQGDDLDSWEVTSPVIGVRASTAGQDGGEGVAVEDPGTLLVEDSVYVTLRSAIYSYSIKPVWWRANASAGGRGEWTNDGCKIVKMHNSLVVFRCDRLAHFGLLQDMAARYRGRGGAEEGAAFRPSAPGVYVGSAVCAAFLMASIATWAAHHSRIATASKNKHSLLNTWVALLLLVALFTAGAHQTHHRPLCQGVGVALHYLTTCVLLWTTVTVTNLYKKVAKALRPPAPPEEAPPDVPLPPKPMLRFYLVGWGIALILCGISAAVNLHQYAGYSFCFLAWGPSLGAFVAPTAALTLILATFFLLTHCSLRSLRAAYPATAAATAETTELELLDAASPGSEAVGGGAAAEEVSLASRDTAASVTDGQHSPLTQLRAHAVTLLLFGLTWTAAAITTAAPFQEVIPHHTAVFSAIYAICASSLGIFIFVFFCLSRGDVWEAWRGWRWGGLLPRRDRKEEEEVRLTSALANNTTVAAQNNQPGARSSEVRGPRDAPSTHSLESSQTHNTNKSSSVSQSILTSTKGEGVVVAKTANNLQLLSLGAMTNDLHYAPEIFYNPKQAGVAKRFFQKQRLRQMVKQNNLEVNRTDSDCNSTVYRPKMSRPLNTEIKTHNAFDPACLGASSKVNNTNIHVDGVFNYMGGEMRQGSSKQASKDPTPEVLCVLGPAPDLYPVGRGGEGERGWSTIPRKPRAFMEEPLSPLRRGGSFPSITEEGGSRGDSRAPSQTSTLDQPPYPPPEPPPQQHPRLYSFPPPGPGPHYHHHHHMQGTEDEPPSRKARGAFTPEQGERPDPASEHPRPGRPNRYRPGRERPRPGRNKRRPMRVRGGGVGGVGAGEGREEWTDDNSPPVIINLSPGDAGRSSGSDKDAVGHQFMPFPVHARSATPPGAPRGMLDQRAHPQDPATLMCMDLTWPHVMASTMAPDHSGRGRSDPAACQCLHGFPPGLEGPTGLGVCCEAEDAGAASWDSEGGEGYWCAGGGEQRASACEVSGCDASSLCGGGLSGSSSSGSSSGSCGGGGGEASEGGSVDPAVGTSPRGSVNISDSPYDSPLHRLHQNTPDSGSLDSGLLSSPGRPPPVHGAAPGPLQGEATTSAESLNLPRDPPTPSPPACYLTNSSAETVLRRSDHGGADSDEGTGRGDEGMPGAGEGKGAARMKGQENGQRGSDGELEEEPEANPKRETCV